MCTKKELVEWLEQHQEIPDNATIEVFEYGTSGGRYYPVELTCLVYDPQKNTIKIDQ